LRRAACNARHRRYRPGGQDAGIRPCVQRVDDLFDSNDGAPRRKDGLLLHAKDAPEQDVALAVCFLRVDDGNIGPHRGCGGEDLPVKGQVMERIWGLNLGRSDPA